MNPENRWVKKAATIPWEAIEEKYAKLFPSDVVRKVQTSTEASDSLIKIA